MRDEEADLTLKSTLAEEGLWVRRSSEGTNGLFRAASVCLFFTEVHQDVLQGLVHSFFANRWAPLLKEDQRVKADRYLENMLLGEFEPLNLEIIGRLFRVNPIVFRWEQRSLQRQSFGDSVFPVIRLLRLGESSFSALFLEAQRPDFVFIQNLLLNLAENAMTGERDTARDLNRGVLINFDFDRWLEQSQPHHAQALRTSADLHFEHLKFGLPAPPRDPPLLNVGSQIITLLRKRRASPGKRRTDQHPHHAFISKNFAEQKIFLKGVKREGPFRRSHSLQPPEKELFPRHPLHELAVDGHSLDPTPERALRCFKVPKEADPSLPQDQGVEGEEPEEPPEDTELPPEDEGAGHSPDEALSEGLENPSPFLAGAEVSAEATDKPRSQKESLREKLRRKHAGANGKLDLSKSVSFQEPSLQSAARTAQIGSSIGLLEKGASQRLLSELKGGSFGKEKYSETVDGRLYTGNLKFFDEKNGFGFFQIVKDEEFEDVFVYKSEFDKADIRVEALKSLKGVYGHTFTFQIASYVVHNDRRKKAINIKLL